MHAWSMVTSFDRYGVQQQHMQVGIRRNATQRIDEMQLANGIARASSTHVRASYISIILVTTKHICIYYYYCAWLARRCTHGSNKDMDPTKDGNRASSSRDTTEPNRPTRSTHQKRDGRGEARAATPPILGLHMPLALKSLMRPKVTAMATQPPPTTRAHDLATGARPSTAPTQPNAASVAVATAATTPIRSL